MPRYNRQKSHLKATQSAHEQEMSSTRTHSLSMQATCHVKASQSPCGRMSSACITVSSRHCCFSKLHQDMQVQLFSNRLFWEPGLVLKICVQQACLSAASDSMHWSCNTYRAKVRSTQQYTESDTDSRVLRSMETSRVQHQRYNTWFCRLQYKGNHATRLVAVVVAILNLIVAGAFRACPDFR